MLPRFQKRRSSQKHTLEFNPSHNPLKTPAGASHPRAKKSQVPTSPAASPPRSVVPRPRSASRSAPSKHDLKQVQLEMAVIAFNTKALKTFLKAHTTHQAFYNRMMTGLKSMVAALMNISSSLIHQADTEMSHNALSGVAGEAYALTPHAVGGPAFLLYYSPAYLRHCVHYCGQGTEGAREAAQHALDALHALAEVFRAARRLWPAEAGAGA